MICDRHTDPELHLFRTAEAAVNYARAQVYERAYSPDNIVDEYEIDELDSWLYYAIYSDENDNVCVLEKELLD